MVSDKTGPVVSFIGYILVIVFSFLFLGQHDLEVMISGHRFVFLRFVFMLGIGAVGIIGGYLFLKGNKFGNYMSLIGGIIAIIGVFIPIGVVGFFGASDFIEYPIALYSTYYIEIILIILGYGLIELNRITVNIQAEKALELAKTIADRNKIKDAMFTYLVESTGKAFTAKAIYKRCIEDAHSEVSISETEKMLYEMNIIGKVQINTKEDVYYYFVA